MSHRLGFAVFSVNDCGERRKLLAKNSRDYLSLFFTDLNEETVQITSKDDMNKALKKYWPLAFLKFNPSDELHAWGQIGIIATTYLACKKLLETDLDGILLVEDDMVIKDGFAESVLRNIANINDQWDLFFQYRPDHEIGADASISSQPNICSLGSYVISRSGAEKLISDCLRGIKYPLDFQYFKSMARFRRYSVGRGAEMFCNLDEEASYKSTITSTQSIVNA